MQELSGFITKNWDGWAMIGDVVFAKFMNSLADKYGVTYEHNDNLGGERAVIDDCQIAMYTTKRKMTFEEAQKKFMDKLFGFSGAYEMEANYTGYSEFTILGFDLDTCCIGGHDINQILLDHIGEYANIRIEVPGEKSQKNNKKNYFVEFKVAARYIVKIESANDIKDALDQANKLFGDADFGEAQDIDGEAVVVEDKNGNRLWEKL